MGGRRFDSFSRSMDKEDLFAHLLKTFTEACDDGEGAAPLGIDYNGVNQTFGIVIDDESHVLPENFVADHPEGGDELAGRIKSWARGGKAE